MSYFSENTKSLFRWPKKYQEIVDLLTGSEIEENQVRCFKTNAHVMVFAASLALKKDIIETDKIPTGSDTNEIRFEIFDKNKFRTQSLTHYIVLIALTYKKNSNLLRENYIENEIEKSGDEEVIEIFTKLALGGLKYLHTLYFSSSETDPLKILMDEISN